MSDLGVVLAQLAGFAFVAWQVRRRPTTVKLGLLAMAVALLFIGHIWWNERLDRLEARVGAIEAGLDRWR